MLCFLSGLRRGLSVRQKGVIAGEVGAGLFLLMASISCCGRPNNNSRLGTSRTYRIDRETNTISALKECSFGELVFCERSHLQEWIANTPSVLGKEFLIIQKEFSGFSDTQERLDLLALDKQGSLVIIENKLDDTGRDVTWQALKYASYYSSLSRDDIKRIFQDFLMRSSPKVSAEERLCEFVGVTDYQEISINMGVTQRIILVAARFRK